MPRGFPQQLFCDNTNSSLGLHNAQSFLYRTPCPCFHSRGLSFSGPILPSPELGKLLALAFMFMYFFSKPT